MSRLLILLLGLTAVQAIIRPGYGSGYSGKKHHHYSGYDECDEGKTKPPKPTTEAPATDAPVTDPPVTEAPTTTVKPTTPTTTTPRMVPECPAGYTLYTRTASSYNNNLGLWCMKLLTTSYTVSVNNASLLCQAEGSELTNYETEAERLAITALAQAHIIGTLGQTEGSIALGGNRVAACQSLNKTWTEYPPCNNNKTLFELPASSQTNPEYSWNSWAAREPNSQTWTYDVEACLQLHIKPTDVEQHGLLNDIFCRFAQAPNQENAVLYWNFGALCGVFPTYSAVA